MNCEEVDLETSAGILADSLAQIFMIASKDELRQQAYRMIGVENNRDFALTLEARLNEYFKSKHHEFDERSISQIYGEKGNAWIILEYFLKNESLPSDIAKKFSSKNLCDRIEKFARNQRSFPRTYLIEMEVDDPSNVSGYQGPSNYQQKLGLIEASPTIIGDEFSDSSEDEVSGIFSSKKRRSLSLSHSKSFYFADHNCGLQAEMDLGNGVERKENLKSFHSSANFDEFSDFSDEFEDENLPQLEALLKTNRKDQFPSSLDAEFSSSDDTEFSSVEDTDFPQCREELTTAFKNVHLNESACQFRNKLFSEDNISTLSTNLIRNPFRRTKSLSK